MATKTKGKAQIEKLNQRLEKLEVQYVAVADIKPNPWNPNRQSEHEAELLKRSMDEDGFTQPVLCVRLTKEDIADPKFKGTPYKEGDLMIVDGEHRWRTGHALGYTEIPCVVYPGSAIQARISTMRHNKARGTHDLELEADLMRDLRELGALSWAQDSLMMDDVEITRLLDDVSAPEALAGDEYAAAWVPGTSTNSNEGEAERFGAPMQVSLTPEAVQSQRDAEKRAAAAKTEEEKATIRKEVALYRINITFSQEQGALVKRVLGTNPAGRILELCEAADTGKPDA